MSVLEQIDARASQLSPELQAEFLDFKKSKNQPIDKESFPRLLNKFGAGKDVITYVAEDFDAPLDDLNEYMY